MDESRVLLVSAVAEQLNPLDFPCEKQRLLDLAHRRGATPRVLQALQCLPEREYRSIHDVIDLVETR